MIRKILHSTHALIGFCMILSVCAIALSAPFLAPHDPNAVHLSGKFLPPTAGYPLGTDHLGRCVLSRLLYGARYSMGIAVPVLLLLAGISTVLGTLGAWFGGVFDAILLMLCDIMMAFPPIVLLLAFLGSFSQSAGTVILSIVFSMWVWFVKVIRSAVLIEKKKGYITAAKIAGGTSFGIIVHHLFPNIVPVIIVYFSTGLAAIILMISAYSFLGVGLGSDTPEWGAMLAYSKQYLYSHPMLIVYPGLCILFAAAGCNIFGEAVRDALSPQEA